MQGHLTFGNLPNHEQQLPRPHRCSIADLTHQSSSLPEPSRTDTHRPTETLSPDAHLSGTPISTIPAHAGTILNPSPIHGESTPTQSLATYATGAVHCRSMSPSLERSPREYTRHSGTHTPTFARSHAGAEAPDIAFSSQSSDASSTQALAMLAEYMDNVMEKPRTVCDDGWPTGTGSSSSPHTAQGRLSKADDSPRRIPRCHHPYPAPHSNLVLPLNPSEPSQPSSLDFLSFPFSPLCPDDPLTSIQVRAPASEFVPLPCPSLEDAPITCTHSELSGGTEHALSSGSDDSGSESVPSPRDTDSVHSQHVLLHQEHWHLEPPGVLTPLTSSPSSGGGACVCCEVCCVQTAFTVARRDPGRKRRQQRVAGELRRMRPRSSSSSSSSSSLSGRILKDKGAGHVPHTVGSSVPANLLHATQMQTHGHTQQSCTYQQTPSALDTLQRNLMLGAHQHDHVVPVHIYLPRIKAPVDATETSTDSLSGDSVASSSPARLHAFLRSLICAPSPGRDPSPGRAEVLNLDSHASPRRSALQYLGGPSAKPSFQCSGAWGGSEVSKSDFQLDSSSSVPTSASQVLPLTAAAAGCSRLSDVSQPQGAFYVFCA